MGGVQRLAAMSEALPLMYSDLADWFHLLSAPDEYSEEAAFISRPSARRWVRCPGRSSSWGRAAATTRCTQDGSTGWS